MRLFNFLLPATFLLLVVSSLSAQTDLPNATDGACWTSLTALQNCAQAQQDRAMIQAESCTSYPEYQCNPAIQATVRPAQLRQQTAKTSPTPKQPSGQSAKYVPTSQGSNGGGSPDQAH